MLSLASGGTTTTTTTTRGRGWSHLQPHQAVTQVPCHDLTASPCSDKNFDDDDGENDEEDGEKNPYPGGGRGLLGLEVGL